MPDDLGQPRLINLPGYQDKTLCLPFRDAVAQGLVSWQQCLVLNFEYKEPEKLVPFWERTDDRNSK